jgi:hypothetical protein
VAQASAASARIAALRRRMSVYRSQGAAGIPGSSRRQSAYWTAASRGLNRTTRTTLSLPVDHLGVVRTEGRSTAAGSHAQR